ncbi:MAG TPA: RES family NAD+ phosphorylase [bacterium]|nr:RES family NAD+ phosphorylase [bacterium]
MDHFKAEEELEALREIADLTNPYVQHEVGAIELVPLSDRIYGPGSGLIMQAFTFPGKASRFSDGSRGTYYAAFGTDTAVTETRYHDEVFLQGSGACTLEKTLIHAYLDAVLLDLRSGRPCPPGIYDPNDYSASQGFGRLVRDLGGYGIAYDSVRHADGKCVAIFRPLVLQNAQAVRTLLYEWDGTTISVK